MTDNKIKFCGFWFNFKFPFPQIEENGIDTSRCKLDDL